MAAAKRINEAATWLRSGQAPVERVADVARALALLSGELDLTPDLLEPALGEDLELALAAQAADTDAIDLLLLLRDHGGSKAGAKLARKALFGARQRGLQVPEKLVARSAVSLARKPDPLPCYCSSFDSTGGQIIVLGGWSPEDGPNAMIAFLSDRTGLETASWFPGMSRTRQRQVLDDLAQRFTGLTVEVGARFAVGRIRWALDVADKLGRSIEGDVAVLRRLVEDVVPIAEIELNLDPSDEARVDERIAASAAMADVSCFQRWLPLGERPASRLLNGLDKEPWLRDPAVVDDDLNDKLVALRTRLLLDTIDDAERLRMAVRLELTGWLLARGGQRETALTAISLARAVRTSEQPLAELPFFAHSLEIAVPVEELLRYVAEVREREEAAASNKTTPA